MKPVINTLKNLIRNTRLQTVIPTVLTILVLSFLLSASAEAKLNVVTSTPDLADIAGRIGGDRISVTSIARGYQDPHFVEPKPSYMLILRKANLYFVVGMDLEKAWSQPLEQGSRNPGIMRGSQDYVDCSRGIRPIEVPVGGADRSMGDVHPYGNPHYLLDPENGIIVARTITEALIRKDPANKSYYEKNRDAFISELRQAEVRWLQKMKPYRGLKVISDHRMWSYFANRFGINVVGEVEPKPGISPSPAHVAGVIKLMKSQDVRLIIRTPYFQAKIPDLIAKNTGARSVVLPSSVGGVSGVNSYIQMFDYLTDTIAKNAR